MKKAKKKTKYSFPIRDLILSNKGLATILAKELGVIPAAVYAATNGRTKPHFNNMIRYKEAMEKITGKKYSLEDLFGKMF